MSESTVHAARPAISGRWALALGGGSDGAEARRALAASYWYCVYAWWRRAGWPEAPAGVVAFLSHSLLTVPPQAEQTGADRFREWLRARLAEWAEGAAEGVEPALEIAAEWAEERYAEEGAGSADELFQRRWALTLLDFTMESLRTDYEARGQAELLAEVTPFAGFVQGVEERQAAAAQRLGFSVGAVRKAISDFRTRHREVLRGYVGDTVANPSDLDGELTALLCACEAAEVTEAGQPEEIFARALRQDAVTGGPAHWMPPAVEELARLFPQYEVRRLLGHGGMGAVYEAHHAALDRLVAIKLLPLEVSADRDFAERFVREARAMARLSHPLIVGVHDFGTTSEGHLFFVMEYVDGTDLRELIHGPGLTVEEAHSILARVCEALAYAHGKGIVHRDIKPANVMVARDGHIKVADFGLARVAEAGQAHLTSAGMVMGTPDYMAPEQARGLEVDQRADLYSLGVMHYEMLCREVPKGIFESPSSRIDCDARVDEIITRAMQQAPERRFQTAEEMRSAIVSLAEPVQAIVLRPVRAIAVVRPRRSRLPLYLGGAALLVTLLGAYYFRPSAKKPAVAQAAVVTPATATREAPFVNSLGMKFIPLPIAGGPHISPQATGQPLVPGAATSVLFSLWETRVQDYATFLQETQRDFAMVRFTQGPTHPAVNLTWFDAQAFCAWLTQRERVQGLIGAAQFYRLPTDHEWSCAVGLGAREDATLPARSKGTAFPEVFPWGTEWPPPRRIANLPEASAGAARPEMKDFLRDYDDGFAWTSPVGSFTPHPNGLYDLSGNAWEWCEDWYEDEQSRVLRGASCDHFLREVLWSCYRHKSPPAGRSGTFGFRTVLSERPPASFAAPAEPPKPVPQTMEFRGHRYLAVLERGLTWATAKARAEALGGHLATVTDAAENEALAAYARKYLTGGNNMFWLGATRTEPEPAGFRWITGEPFGFTAWGPNNPSSRRVGDWLTYMHYTKPEDMTAWNDYELEAPVENLAYYLRGFLVEWDSPAGGK